MGFGKDILVFDTTEGGDIVGAYLKSAAGVLITDTSGALNVNVANTVAVSATDLDIRDLSHTQDSVKIGDGTDFLLISGSGEAMVIESNLTALKKLEDAAHSSGDAGIQMLAVRSDAGGSLSGTDGDYSPLQVDSSGALRVAASIAIAAQKAEDAASSSGDIGSYVLNVRQDVPATSTSADADYQSFKSDVIGRLWVNDAGQAFFNNAVSVTSSATQLTASPLATRKKVILQNRSNRAVFFGDSGMTDTTTGMGIAAGSTVELHAGPACNLYLIAATGTNDVRFFEV